MINASLGRYAVRLRAFLLAPLMGPLERLQAAGRNGSDAATQIGLILRYRGLVQAGSNLPSFRDVGFKVYSQADEDGILLYIFALIGTTDKRCVEICAGDGTECNTTNLIISHQWTGLLFDGNPDLVQRGQRFFRDHPATYVYPPRLICAWITRENINSAIQEHGFNGEVDLLSLDVDGVDYWLWEAIQVISPRVVVLEYQDILGPDRACTVPYTEDFCARSYPTTDGMPNFSGASLRAFVNLGKRKRYRLVGCNAYGYNAFFVKKGVGEDVLPEIPVEDCFKHPKVLWGMKERFPTVKNLPWVDV